MTIEFDGYEYEYVREPDEGGLIAIEYQEYRELRLAAHKALEALQWNYGGEPLPTLELEAIVALKKVLNK